MSWLHHFGFSSEGLQGDFLIFLSPPPPHSSPPKPALELPVAHPNAAVGGCSQRDTDSGGRVKNSGC